MNTSRTKDHEKSYSLASLQILLRGSGSNHMKKIFVAFIIVGLVLAACNGGATPTATQAPPVVTDDFAVIAEGRLLPRDSTQIAFGASGYVAEIRVSEGLTVTAGQVIARLDDTAQKAQVAQA